MAYWSRWWRLAEALQGEETSGSRVAKIHENVYIHRRCEYASDNEYRGTPGEGRAPATPGGPGSNGRNNGRDQAPPGHRDPGGGRPPRRRGEGPARDQRRCRPPARRVRPAPAKGHPPPVGCPNDDRG